MAELMKKLIRQRGSYKAQLTRLHKAVVDVENPVDVEMFNQRQQKLEEIYNSFGSVQLEIESLEDNPEHEIERAEFERHYYECSDDIRKGRGRVATANNPQNLSTINMASSSPPSGRSILPKIHIKPFDGNYAEWNSFYDTFRDLVHENESLPVVHKFHLLKSYLFGDASTVVGSISASEEHYMIAWELLQKRFNKPRKIVHAHIRALFELEEVPSNSTAALGSLADKVEMHVKALKSLGQPTDWHEMLIYIVGAKLDKDTRIHWERSVDESVMPTLEQLLEFLNKFARDAEPVSLLVAKPKSSQRERPQFAKRGDRPHHAYIQGTEGVGCPVCQKGHFIQDCGQFLALDPRARVLEVRKARICHNCFRAGHSTVQCRKANCSRCGKKHHVLLHFEATVVERATMAPGEERASGPTDGIRALVSYQRSEVLLATTRIIILDRDKKEKQCRGLLDPGAQFNFMTQRLAKSLGLKLHTFEVPVLGLGANSSSVQYYVKTRFKSRCSNYSETVMFLILPVITGRLPACKVDPGKVPVPKKLRLADPEFYKPTEVDVLFGEYIYYRALDIGQIRLPNRVSVLQKTRFGWVLSGRTSCAQPNNAKRNCYLARLGLEDSIAKFWELEECPTQRYFSAEEKVCEQHYQQNVSRDDEGRYVVRLPFNGEVEKLGDSYQRALKRFRALECRLGSQKELYRQYKDFISEYIELGHMSIINDDKVKEGFYLPHHAVIKIPEQRANIALVSVIDIDKFDLCSKFSSFRRLQRVTAYCLRFCSLASRKSNLKGELTALELRVSHDIIIKLTQAQVFRKELAQLKGNKPLDASSKLLGLTPFVDANGIIRVGGRLKNSDMKYAQRHPILLPKSHSVTTLIIRNEHIRNLHAGTQATLNAVRQVYWQIDGRNSTRFMIRKCLRCFKAKPTSPPNYLMGDLPRDRLVATRPFENVGVDYCGPFYIKEKRFRNQKRLKVYVAVYICFLTKAVHLEVVSDLTTEAFIASLKRFFARRGKAKNVYSDNGSNFVGANNELVELFDFLRRREVSQEMTRYLNELSVSWHFSPPNSPHFGGLWEAAVKSFKYHLIRTVGDTLVTFEQLNTYVIEIEGVLNSRPLTPLSSDPNDLQALTPAHFLIGGSSTALPERDFSDVPSNRLSVWQHVQKMKQHFWVRWHKEYMNEIRIRSKWKQGSSEMLSVNDLVLIRDDGLPALRWPLGRVLEVHPGADGVNRVATVKTADGIYKRSVKKLCPLPIDFN